MAFDLDAIRHGLAKTLKPITETHAYAYVPDNPSTPALMVAPGAETVVDYQQAMGGGLVRVPLRVLMLVSKASERGGQKKLDEFISAGTGKTKSVVDAIEDDPTLDGTVSTTVVESVTGYGPTLHNEVLYLGAILNLTVHLPRT